MVEEDLGEATIVYEDPDGGAVERTVQNEHVAYFQDHWIVRTDESEAGHDTVRRIPAERVYYVERDVEEFEREVATVFDELQSVADEFGRGVGSIRDEFRSVAEEVGTVLGGGGYDERGESEAYQIDIEGDDSTGDEQLDSGPDAGTAGDEDGGGDGDSDGGNA